LYKSTAGFDHGTATLCAGQRRIKKTPKLLLSYAAEVKDSEGFWRAVRVYERWLRGEIGFREALREIRRLAGRSG